MSIGEDNQGSRMVVGHSGKRFVDLGRRARLERAHRQLQGASRFLNLLVLPRLVAILRIVEDCNAGERGNKLLEHLKPFAHQFRRNAGHPSGLAARSRNAGNQAVKRVARRHDNRNCGGRFLGRLQPLIPPDQHHVHIETGKLAGQFREAIEISFRPPSFDDDVLSLDIAQFPQALAKSVIDRRRRRKSCEPSEARQFVRLLCVGGERHPSKYPRAAENRYELAPLHESSPLLEEGRCWPLYSGITIVARLLRVRGERPSSRRTNNYFDEITPSHCLPPGLRTTPTMGLQQGFATGGMGSDRHVAWQQSSGPNVCFGSKINACPRRVRFTPKSGHWLS